MHKLYIGGLKIDIIDKSELLNVILKRIRQSTPTWVTTVYSEFLVAGLKKPNVMSMLNQADIAIPDGIGIFWAKKFLQMPFTAKNYWLKIIQAYWQALKSLPQTWGGIKGEVGGLKEKIPGSELIWDIARMAEENNFSIYLLGGFGDTPKKVALSLITKHLALKVRYSNKNPNDRAVINDIYQTNADILLVAYGPIKQEEWILENREKLPSVKLFMGVGGTFDYIAGKRISPWPWIRKIGLEWLFRLFTQPHRIKRIYNATFKLILMLIRYKVFNSYGYRKNVACVILNQENKILIAKRSKFSQRWEQKKPQEYENYWQFPQGGMDGNEAPEATAKREIFEETGIKNIKTLYISEKKNIYKWRNALRPLFRNRAYLYSGQEQNVVYFQFFGKDEEIKLAPDELTEYKWIPIKDLKKTIHPERNGLVKIVLEDMKNIIN